MAKLRLPAHVIAAAGSTLGLTYRRSRYGPICYPKQHTRRFRTNSQRITQRYFADAAHHWHDNLTDAQRQAWNRFARNCPPPLDKLHPIPTSGYNAFISFNALPHRFYLAILDDPPPVPARSQPLYNAISWSPSPNYLVINWATTPLLAGEHALIYCSHPLTPSKINPRTWTLWRTSDYGPQSGSRVYYRSPALPSGFTYRIAVTRYSNLYLPSVPQVVFLPKP